RSRALELQTLSFRSPRSSPLELCVPFHADAELTMQPHLPSLVAPLCSAFVAVVGLRSECSPEQEPGSQSPLMALPPSYCTNLPARQSPPHSPRLPLQSHR